MARENVKIPAKHYVGMQKRHGDGLPLGFMTPWGEDAAAAKRMQTVDRWAGRNGLPAVTIDNVPMSGFKLTKSIRTTNYGGHDHWRVEDPRGFELEISSGNLAQLISVGTVEQGEFLDQCVWARHGSNNVLLSTATEEYKEAVENTRVAGIKSNWKDVKLGNRIVLQNNTKGRWLGKMHLASKGYSRNYDSSLGQNEIETSSKTLHLILSEEKQYSWTQTLYMVANPKLSYIQDASTVITAAEAELEANALLADPKTHVQASSYRTPLAACFDVLYCENLSLSLVPVTDLTPSELEAMLLTYSDEPKLYGRNADGAVGLLSKHSNNVKIKMTKISEPHLAEGQLRTLQVPNKERRTSWSGTYSSPAFVMDVIDCDLQEITEFYHLNLNVKTQAGNDLNCLLR